MRAIFAGSATGDVSSRPVMPRSRHQFRFGKRRDAHAARASGKLAFGDLDAFVGFRVRPQSFAGAIDVLHHALQVGFKGVQIQQQRGCKDFCLVDARLPFS